MHLTATNKKKIILKIVQNANKNSVQSQYAKKTPIKVYNSGLA